MAACPVNLQSHQLSLESRQTVPKLPFRCRLHFYLLSTSLGGRARSACPTMPGGSRSPISRRSAEQLVWIGTLLPTQSRDQATDGRSTQLAVISAQPTVHGNSKKKVTKELDPFRRAIGLATHRLPHQEEDLRLVQK